MAEPTNTKPRKLVDVKKGKLDLSQRKQGSTPKAVDMEAPKPGMEAMNLGDVDNENKEDYNEKVGPRQKADWHNVDFDKLHNDFELIKDAKKKPHAGE